LVLLYYFTYSDGARSNTNQVHTYDYIRTPEPSFKDPTVARLVKNYYTFYAIYPLCYMNSAAGFKKIFTRESRCLFYTANETTCLLRNRNFDYRSV